MLPPLLESRSNQDVQLLGQSWWLFTLPRFDRSEMLKGTDLPWGSFSVVALLHRLRSKPAEILFVVLALYICLKSWHGQGLHVVALLGVDVEEDDASPIAHGAMLRRLLRLIISSGINFPSHQL
jgi:hypothetical protein